MESSSSASRAWPLAAAPTALLVVACLVGGAAGALIFRVTHGAGSASQVTHSVVGTVRPALKGDAVWSAGVRTAPGFSLRDQNGQLVSLSSQRGHVVLLAFMDSHCKLLCTFEGPTIHRIMGHLGSAAANVRLIVVSVNPWEDTPASARAAAARWGFSGSWHWLNAAPGELRGVWNGYGIEVKRALGDVNHSSAVYVIDRRGYERAGFNYPFPAPEVARDLRKLARA